MFIGRFVIFDLQESSKYLIAKNRDEEAIQVRYLHLNTLVWYWTFTCLRSFNTLLGGMGRLLRSRSNNCARLTWLPPKPSLRRPTGRLYDHHSLIYHCTFCNPHLTQFWPFLLHLDRTFVHSLQESVLPSIAQLPFWHGVRFLRFSVKWTWWWTVILGFIGLAYPLFNSFLPLYLNTRFATATDVSTGYRNYVIISVMGIPGSIIACLVVDWTRKKSTADDREDSSENEEKRLREDSKPYSFWSGLGVIGGRKLTMTISTLLTGIFLFLFTTSKNQAAVLGWSCASGLTQ